MLTKKQITGLIDTHKGRSFIDQREWDKVRSWYTSDASGNYSQDLPQGAGSPVDQTDDLSPVS